MEPDEPCRTHTIPPHMRDDRGPGDCPPCFRFVIHYRTSPDGIARKLERWAPGPHAAEQAALRELIGRYGPFGLVPESVSVGAPRRAPKPKPAKLRLFEPR